MNYSNFCGEEVTHSLPIDTTNKSCSSLEASRVTLPSDVWVCYLGTLNWQIIHRASKAKATRQSHINFTILIHLDFYVTLSISQCIFSYLILCISHILFFKFSFLWIHGSLNCCINEALLSKNHTTLWVTAKQRYKSSDLALSADRELYDFVYKNAIPMFPFQ